MTIEKKDAIQAALDFIAQGRHDFIIRSWSSKGIADLTMTQAQFEGLKKVLLVGIGELSK